jgi:hypothetical protein
MTKSLLRTFLAVTFVFAVVYGTPACQAGALTGAEKAAGKGLVKASRKLGKKVRHWWDDQPEAAREHAKEGLFEPFKDVL